MARSLYIALILLSLIWGGSFFFIKHLLHEPIGWNLIIGLILILSGVFIASRGARSSRLSKTPIAASPK